MSRLVKLRAMPPAEIAGRIRTGVRAAVERALDRPGLAARPDHLENALQPGIAAGNQWKRDLLAERRRRTSCFFPAFSHPDAMRQLFSHEYRESWARTNLEADRARRHAVHFFGQTFELGSRIDWHADPVSRRRWPDRWHRDIDVTVDEGPSDVKYVWELNRHQFLIDLGKRYWLLGDPADAAEVLAIVRDWIAQNRYGRGINWASPLEPAYRSLSWLWAYHFCLDAPSLDDDTHALWLASFYDHGCFLQRHLELYASPFNHLIGEATVLYLLGLVFPEFRDAKAWRTRGRQVLETRLPGQFHEDGGSVEQATFYHHATLGFYLLAALLGRANGDELPPAVWQAIERGTEFSMYLVQPDGRVPMIGDSDDAKPIRLEHRTFWDFRAFQAIGAVLFDRPDFKHVAGDFPEDALWLLGPGGRDRFLALDAGPPRETSKALRQSGYFVLRSDWSDTADYACVDCGEQAGGLRRDEVPSAAHGHADCLSVTLFLGGRPALVDAGFYTYNGDEPWERHFRETAAHNTARIDGRDQARHLAKMAWSEVAQARLEHWAADGRQAAVVGSHDGYGKEPRGVVHRRTVWLRPGGYILLYDEFIGVGDNEHRVELNFQLPPCAAGRLGATGLVTGDALRFCWFGSQSLSATLREGGVAPDHGWVAPSLGVRLPAPRLTLTSTLRRRHEAFLTVVADLAAMRVADIRAASRRERTELPLGVVIRTGEFVDHVTATAGTAATTGPFETDASLAVWRLKQERLVETVRIGGTYMRMREEPRFQPARRASVR